MKHARLKAILIYMGILFLIILAMVINNLENFKLIGPETDDLFTCTGFKGTPWNCDFWTFFKYNIIGDIFITGIFMPHYTLIFLVLSFFSIFGIEKFLIAASEKIIYTQKELKNTSFKSVCKLLTEMFKSPWSYFGGIFFVIFLSFFVSATQMFFVYRFSYLLQSIESLLIQIFNNISPQWGLASFLLGIIIFFGYKKHQKWAWTILFFALPTFILTITTQFFSFMWYLLCDNSKYVCDGTTDAGFDYRAVQESPYGSIVLLTIIAILLFAFVRLYIKRKNYNVKNIIFDVLFWFFNISFAIFMIYGLIETFTREYRIGG